MSASSFLPDQDEVLRTSAWLSEATIALRWNPEIAKRHPNGFFKVTLPSQGGLVRRIHVWTPESAAEAEESNVHGHCWPFVSKVLTGCLREDLYIVGPGDDYSEHSFEGNDSPLRYIRKAGLVHVGTDRHDAGNMYQRSPFALHRVKPWRENCLTVSAVIHSVSRRRAASVFVEDDKSVDAEPRKLAACEMRLLRDALHQTSQEVSALDRSESDAP